MERPAPSPELPLNQFRIVTIRPATAADVTAMMSLEQQSSTAAHWTEAQYQQFFQRATEGAERLIVVAEESLSADSVFETGPRVGAVVIGFLVARHLAPEWELENIVVAQASRRNGLGRQLLEALLSRARETNSEAVFLEVRESNTSARALYESAGFEQTGRRKAYYTSPGEDAILYRRGLG